MQSGILDTFAFMKTNRNIFRVTYRVQNICDIYPDYDEHKILLLKKTTVKFDRDYLELLRCGCNYLNTK